MIKLVGLLFVVVFSLNSKAGDITHLRWDSMIPDHCHSNQVSDFFSEDLEYLTYSRTGGVKRGFDREYKISREDIRRFWSIFKNDSHDEPEVMNWVHSRDNIEQAYFALKDNYEVMDFSFNDEGQILELLAIVELKKELDLDRYYVTGSVAYSGGPRENRLGELDLVVADVESCQAVMVGEVKVNPKRLSLARSQLQRFRRFLDQQRTSWGQFAPK